MQYSNEKEELYLTVKGIIDLDLVDYMFFLFGGRGRVVFFFHNLNHDAGVMFPQICVPEEDDIKEQIKNEMFMKGIKAKVIYGKPEYLSFSKSSGEKNRSTLVFMDTAIFFRGKLEKNAERMNLKLRKLEHPDCLGREPTLEELPYFMEYAMRDSQITFNLGKEIYEMHKRFNLSIKNTVTPASYSSKVFRKCFVDEPIPFPPRSLRFMALRSYWGGRTESFCAGKTDIKYYDINSSYPYSATQIKIPMHNSGWKYTKEWKGVDGFYKVSGFLPEMRVSPLLIKKNRLVFPIGEYKNVIMTGWEAEQVMKYSEDFKIEGGYYYKGKTSDCLKNYMLKFYEKKKEYKKSDPILCKLYKDLINSLYGKFIQINRGERDTSYINPVTGKMVSEIRKFEASGLFNPVVGAWITGHARTNLFKFMKEYENYVCYCDTDSMILQADCPKKVRVSQELGDMKLESEGVGVLMREKLYLVFDKQGKIIQSANHGFWETPKDLYDMIKQGKNTYTTRRMVKLKEARKQHKKAFVFENQLRSLDLSTSKKRQGSGEFDYLNDFKWLAPLKLPLS